MEIEYDSILSDDPFFNRIYENLNSFDSTPERRLWISVLIRTLDDVRYLTQNKSCNKIKRYMNKSFGQDTWAEREIFEVFHHIKSDWFKDVCSFAGVDYNFFISFCERMTKESINT